MSQKVETSQQVIEYDITDKAITILSEKYKDLTIEDTKSYNAVVSGISEVRNLRVSVEKRRKELKASSIEWGRKVDSEAKRITQMLVNVEEPLKLLKTTVDDEKAKIKAEKERLKQERIERLRAKIRAIQEVSLSMGNKTSEQIKDVELPAIQSLEIDKDEYEEFYEQAVTAKEKSIQQVTQIMLDHAKVEAERAAIERERKRQAEERQRLEAEKKKQEEAQRIVEENNRLQMEKQKEAQRILEEKNLIEKEKRDEAQRLIDEKNQLAREKIEAEEKALADKKLKEELRIEAEQKLIEDKKKMILQEQAQRKRNIEDAKKRKEEERLEKERLDALRPDAEKMRGFANKDLMECMDRIPTFDDGNDLDVLSEMVVIKLTDVQTYILHELIPLLENNKKEVHVNAG